MHLEAETARRVARQRQRLGLGQRHARGRVVGLHRQLATATVDQHRQLHAGRAAVVKEFVEHRTDGAAGVEHIVEHQDVGAVDFKRQLRLAAGRQAALRVVVAVHDRRNLAALAFEAQLALQPLGQPGAARGDAHQPRVRLAQAAHPAQQLLVQGLCVQCQSTHGKLLRNCSRMIAAAAASASRAPWACASVVL